MLALPLKDAKAGMTLAAPIPHPENPEQTLLKRGYLLENTVLRRLESMGVTNVYVDFPGLEDLDRHLMPVLSPERQQIYTQVRDIIRQSQTRARPAIAFHAYVKSMRDMVTNLMAQGDNPVYMDTMARLGNDAVGHATAVAHLSLLLGMKLERYLISERKRLPANQAKDPANLGVAAMLHDIGKTKLAPALQQAHIAHLPEVDTDRLEYEQHCVRSYEIVQGHLEPSAACAILQHHQYYDGSGFGQPKNNDRAVPTGRGIHVFARIIMVADLYDRLTTTMPGQPRRTPLEALYMLRTVFANRCDPEVLSTLQTICPPLPPGQIINLSDQTQAVVVDINPVAPYRPIIKRMSADGTSVEGEAVDLHSHPQLRILTSNGINIDQFIPRDGSAYAA